MFYSVLYLFFHKLTKLCSEVQNFVETEHFTDWNQAIAANRRRGLLIFGGVA